MGPLEINTLATVRLKIIGNEMIKNVGQSESCMVSKWPIIFKGNRSRSIGTRSLLHRLGGGRQNVPVMPVGSSNDAGPLIGAPLDRNPASLLPGNKLLVNSGHARNNM